MNNTRRTSSLHDPRYQNLIESLIQLRKRAEITQLELAEALHMSQPDISKIERFERRLDILEFLDWLQIIAERSQNLPSEIWKKIYESYSESGRCK